MTQPLTKDEIRQSSGTFNPVGHVVIGFDNEAIARDAAKALGEAGFAAEDLLVYNAAEFGQSLRGMVDTTSEGAGFGYEITLMRRYLKLADEGCAWLIVHVPDSEATQRVADVAARHSARCAVRYHLLASEDLI